MPKAKTWEQHKEECQSVAKKGITVVGWIGEWLGSKTKLHCRCEEHGDWLTASINSFKQGSSCPACSGCKIKTWEEIRGECESVCQDGIQILGFVGEWHGVKNKLVCSCSKHGVWKTTSVYDFRNGVSCPSCAEDKKGKFEREPEEAYVQSFMKTGAYPAGAIFHKTSRSLPPHSRVIWEYICPVCSHDEYVQAGLCSGVFETIVAHLKRGVLPCRCAPNYRYTKEQWTYRVEQDLNNRGLKFLEWIEEAKGSSKLKYLCAEHGVQIATAYSLVQNGTGCPICAGNIQRQAYINRVLDEDGIVCALKFGIATNQKRRLYIQNWKNAFTMNVAAIYVFDSSTKCKAAEKKCKAILNCQVLNKYQLFDGYTETTSLENYQKIVEIYESFGGKLQK